MPTQALLDSGIVTADYSEDSGTTWIELVGITNYTINRDAAQQRQVATWGGRTRSLAGASGTRTVTLEGVRPPLDPNWARLEVLGDQRAIVPQFRIRGSEREVTGETAAGNTIAIAMATGAVTFAGTPDKGDFDNWAPGMSFKDGAGNFYAIKTITEAGVVTVDPPSADVNATVYSVVEGAAQRIIRGDIINIGQDSLSEGSELTDTISINVQSIEPWKAV